MALQREFTFRGATANYLTLLRFDELDYGLKRCTAVFALYANAATAAQHKAGGDPNVCGPIVERAARLRLQGDKFDQWVGKAVGKGPVGQAYLAAKAEPVDYWGGTLANLADAADV